VKNIYLLQLTDTFWDFIPALWPSAKSYYELYGTYPEKYNWILPVCEFYQDIEAIKKIIEQAPPDIFGVSLYVWNYEKSLSLCKWVKNKYPECVVITGGPQQYFKHDKNWFKKYNFIDASLPSEVYGELAICDVLDNLQDNNSINWNLVEQIVYASQSKNIILKSPKSTAKRDFKWGYPAYFLQANHIQQYVHEYFAVRQNPRLWANLETTRGCPYECAYCDWGGGIGTKVVVKDLDYVKLDLDTLAKFNITNLHICDANFGITGARDIEITEYIGSKKKESNGRSFVNLMHSGYAKTHHHFDTIKQIISLEAKHDLSCTYKISQQSFHQHILDNIKRTDLRHEQHFEIANYVRTKFKFDSTVEIIMGLPGTTVASWIEEFDIPYNYNVFVSAYEWFLLPEAESFDHEYRQKWGIETAKKIGFDTKATDLLDIELHPMEVVVGGNSFTREDYQSMMEIYMCYYFIVQSGVYAQTIKQILLANQLKFSEFLKDFYFDCYKILKTKSNSLDSYQSYLKEYTSDNINKLYNEISWNNTSIKVSHRFYLIIEYFKNFELLSPILESWLISQGANLKILEQESELIVSEQRLHKNKKNLFNTITYNHKITSIEDLIDYDKLSYVTFCGDLLLAKKNISLNLLQVF